ncbi:MAG: 3-dehydroquinate synthase [Acidimicrobiia bacterium]|nr:3-dehydroquinate synthase [Acidimicrobiia bacterium]
MEQILINERSEILIGRGTPDPFLPPRTSRTQAAVLAQPGAGEVADRTIRAIRSGGTPATLKVMPDGDAVKDMQVASSTYEWLAELNIGRHDTIVGVGGGAITDFAGFIAGTWLRGVEAVYQSTTLLGAVDASVGGKTGLNLRGKNLIGLFRHPSRVVIDVNGIEQLPEHLLREGFAEAIKAGFIADPGLVDLFDRSGGQPDLTQVITRAVRVKVDVVSADFREEGRRGILNYGHTIGHGIEVAAGISHGEAVAIGMVAAGAVSEIRCGFRGAARQRGLLEQLGLPVVSPGVDLDQVRRLIGLDKKRDAEGLRMALLEDFGRTKLVYVTDDDISVGLAAVGLV